VARENTWEERVNGLRKQSLQRWKRKALALGSPGESPHGEALPVREHRLPELLDSILTFLARHTYIPNPTSAKGRVAAICAKKTNNLVGGSWRWLCVRYLFFGAPATAN